MKKIFMIVFSFSAIFFYPQNSDPAKNDSIVQRYNEILLYGIESEVADILPLLGKNPKKEFYPMLLDRYKTSASSDVKNKLIDFFAECDNLPENITELLYQELKKEPMNVFVHTKLINFIGKKGNTEQQRILIERLDYSNDAIKNAAAETISQITNKDLAKILLERLELSDKDNEKFLINDIKAKLILGLGKMKSKDSLTYLRNTAKENSNDKFLIMFSMVALGDMQDIESLEIIKKNLSSDEPKIQEYAAYSLSVFKAKEAIPVLREMLKNNNEKIRIYACKGLVLNNDLESAKILLYKMKNDPQPNVKKEALMSLVYLGIPGINILKDNAKEKDFSDNDLAQITESVRMNPSNESVDFLISLYEKYDKKKKDIIIKNILFGTSNKLDRLVDIVLKSEDPINRINALKTIYQIKDSTLWPKVKEISDNDKNENVKKFAKNFLELRGK